MWDLFVQFVGFLGVACYLLSYQIKSNRKLFLAQSAGNFLFMVQFFLLQAYSGCLTLLVCIIRNLIASKYNQWAWVRWKGWSWVFSIATAAAAAVTWNGWTSLLPVAGIVTCNFTFWTNNALNIRKGNLFVASPAWIIYDTIFHSWGGVMNEVITMTSILISVWRFGWNNLGSTDSEFSNE